LIYAVMILVLLGPGVAAELFKKIFGMWLWVGQTHLKQLFLS
jgi:hypothetical protein